MSEVLDFMESPLMLWVKSFNETEEMLDFQEICDGVYFSDVFFQIDQRDLTMTSQVHRMVKDTNTRLQNWLFLCRNIRSYYQDVLQQLITMQIPDVVSVVTEPTKESGLIGMKKILLLLLGCAVQCDRKENYINAIKRLDLKTQEGIVDCIREITDSRDNIFSLDYSSDSEMGVRNFYNILKSVVQERDSYAEELVELTQEKNYYHNELTGSHGVRLLPPPSLEKYHLSKELTDYKNRLHSLCDELEEKTKVIEELREELKETESQLTKTKTENLDLSKDAKSARTYRDELDTFKEKALKADRYEKEIRKYKEKARELEYLKSRVEELREDNNVLSESKMKSDHHMQGLQRRNESLMDEVVRLQLQIEDAITEKDSLQRKVQEVMEENAVLEFEKSNISEGFKSGAIRRILSYSSVDLRASQLQLPGHPIAEELNDTMAVNITRIEIENDELKNELNKIKQTLTDTEQELRLTKIRLDQELQNKAMVLENESKSIRQKISLDLSKEFHERVTKIELQSTQLKKQITVEHQRKIDSLTNRIKVLEKENEDLRKKVLFVQEGWEKEKEQYSRLDKLNRDLLVEQEHFKQTISVIRESSDSRVQQLEDEVDKLSSRVAVLKQHNNKITNLCDYEITKDNVHYAAIHAAAQEELQRQQLHNPVKSKSTPKLSSPLREFSSRFNFLRGQKVLRDKSKTSGQTRPSSLTAIGQTQDAGSSMFGIGVPSKNSPVKRSLSAFVRNDPSRTTLQNRPASCSGSFNRNDRSRMTMPERQRRSPIPHSLTPDPTKRTYRNFQRERREDDLARSMPSFKETISDQDSGLAISPDSHLAENINFDSDSDGFGEDLHRLTSVQIVSSETFSKQWRMHPSPQMTEKWKLFIDKIVVLQNKNQELIVENSDLRRNLNMMKLSSNRVEYLEGKNLQLEIENRKLHKIIDTLQCSLAGRNPFDKKLYHFYSNV